MSNPFLWWVEPAASAFESIASYCEQVAEIPAHQPISPILNMAANSYSSLGDGMRQIAEAADYTPSPEYTVEAGGVLRPAAWQ